MIYEQTNQPTIRISIQITLPTRVNNQITPPQGGAPLWSEVLGSILSSVLIFSYIQHFTKIVEIILYALLFHKLPKLGHFFSILPCIGNFANPEQTLHKYIPQRPASIFKFCIILPTFCMH